MSELTLSYTVLYATLSTDCVCEAFEKNEKIRRYVCYDENLRGNAGVCYTEYMPDIAAPVERLIYELKHLPGIGQKTAQRLAFYILRAAPEDALGLADA